MMFRVDRFQVCRQADRKRHNGQRWVRVSGGWKHRTAGNEEVLNAVDSAVRVGHASFRVTMHTGRSDVMCRIRGHRPHSRRRVEITLKAAHAMEGELLFQEFMQGDQGFPLTLSNPPMDLELRDTQFIFLVRENHPAFSIRDLLKVIDDTENSAQAAACEDISQHGAYERSELRELMAQARTGLHTCSCLMECPKGQ